MTRTVVVTKTVGAHTGPNDFFCKKKNHFSMFFVKITKKIFMRG